MGGKKDFCRAKVYILKVYIFLTSTSGLQCVLEQLVSEYNKLNEALRTEKRLYQNLTQLSRSDG